MKEEGQIAIRRSLGEALRASRTHFAFHIEALMAQRQRLLERLQRFNVFAKKERD